MVTIASTTTLPRVVAVTSVRPTAPMSRNRATLVWCTRKSSSQKVKNLHYGEQGRSALLQLPKELFLLWTTQMMPPASHMHADITPLHSIASNPSVCFPDCSDIDADMRAMQYNHGTTNHMHCVSACHTLTNQCDAARGQLSEGNGQLPNLAFFTCRPQAPIQLSNR